MIIIMLLMTIHFVIPPKAPTNIMIMIMIMLLMTKHLVIPPTEATTKIK